MLYRFDGFELDHGSLRASPRRQPVPRRAAGLRPDRLLSSAIRPGAGAEEIVDQVWQGRAVSGGDDLELHQGGAAGARVTAATARATSAPSAAAASSSRARSSPPTRLRRGRRRPPTGQRHRASERGRPASAAQPILAVLPFANLSAEADEYFADGLTEDIIINLARFRDLRVIAGASTFHFKGRDVRPGARSARGCGPAMSCRAACGGEPAASASRRS